MDEVWWVIIAIGVLMVPAILWWWRIADQWVDDEHKRFKPKKDRTNDRSSDGLIGASAAGVDASHNHDPLRNPANEARGEWETGGNAADQVGDGDAQSGGGGASDAGGSSDGGGGGGAD